MRIVIDILIVISILFAIAGAVGLIRMPDTYTRMQSSTNISTLGIMGVIIAAILYSIIFLKDYSMAVKLGALLVFYLITNPIGSHALARASYRSKVKPSEKTVVDQYGKDLVDVPDEAESEDSGKINGSLIDSGSSMKVSVTGISDEKAESGVK